MPPAASAARRLPRDALTLRDFLHRSRVLAQYRAFLREVRGLDNSRELVEQVRAAFRAAAGERNRANVKAALAEGERQLIFLRSYVGTARRGPNGPMAEGGPTWVGTGEADDVRGRVGAGWPWRGEGDDGSKDGSAGGSGAASGGGMR